VSARDAFLFDLDGTLIDSIGLIEDSYQHTLAAHGYPRATRAEWLEGLGRPLSVQFARLGAAAEQVEAMVATYRRWNLAQHDARVRPFEGIHAALAALAGAGARLAVVTSKHSTGALRGLAHCGLADFFEVVICSDHVSDPKPAPQPVLLALQRLGAQPARAVMIGDSPHDLESGRAAGVRTAAVAWGPLTRAELERHRPDLWIDSVAGLARLPLL
jgi:pyrophosphatase PpaX